MILSFKTKINGKPTYFMEKIWAGLEEICDANNFCIDQFHKGLLLTAYDDSIDREPKLHTIRKDEKNRWKSGVLIDFFINARQKNMFRFAPRIPLISRQTVFMTYLPHLGNGFEVSIDGRQIDNSELEQLAINDGFDRVEDFANYFISEMEENQCSMKILHWTDLRY